MSGFEILGGMLAVLIALGLWMVFWKWWYWD